MLTLLVAASAEFSPASAQGWWPWDNKPEPRPTPREPVYRPPPQMAPPPVAQPAPGTWGTKNPICFQLEQRLVQEGTRGNQSRDLVPMVESEIRQVDQLYRQAQGDLERRQCYEYFLFSKSLRNTRQCVDLARQAEDAKRRLSDLDTQRQELVGSAGRSYQDDIIRELARNNCGETYQQQARRHEDNGPFSNFWQQEGESTGGGGLGNYGNLGYATYRTLCVRLCDGYYFPVSFSTLPNHFQRDADVCQSKCAAPVELYYHQNPGGAVEQMVGVSSNTPYTQLKSAFRYRKEYVQGCSCKQAEFVPPQSTPPQRAGEAAPPSPNPTSGQTAARRADSLGDGGWSAAIEQPR